MTLYDDNGGCRAYNADVRRYLGDDPSGLENVYKCFYVIHACK